MVVKVDLTEKMINEFRKCDKRKEYRQFYKDHIDFFKRLEDNLKFMKSSYGLDDFIISKFKICLNYLWKWDRDTPFLYGSKATDFEKNYSEFFKFLQTDILRGEWKNLYSEYVYVADSLIRRARKQGIIDFQIEYKSKFYGTFRARDLAIRAEEGISVDEDNSDAADYSSSDSSDEDDVDEYEDSSSDDFDNISDEEEEEEEDVVELVKKVSEKLDDVSQRISVLEDSTKTLELTTVINNFKNEINFKLEKMESRIQANINAKMQELIQEQQASKKLSDRELEAEPGNSQTMITKPPQLTEDPEIQKIQAEFEKALAEQNRAYGNKLREIQDRRRELNQK